MKAYVFEKSGELNIRELGAPELGGSTSDRRAAILKPLFVSPCSSDVHTVFGGSKPRRENMILGHEGLGDS